MNKELITRISLAGGGLVVGLGAGYFAAKAHLDRKYAKRADEEIESVKSMYTIPIEEDAFGYTTEIEGGTFETIVKVNEYNQSKTLITEHDLPVSPIGRPKPGKDYRNIPINDKEDAIEAGISELESNMIAAMDADPEDVDSDDDGLYGDRSPEKPYIISVAEYSQTKEHYEKQPLTYYETGETLADEANQIIPDIHAVLGSKALNHFGDGSSHPDFVYVRNERIATDFEVHRVESSYLEQFGGFETPGLEG